MYPMPPTWNDDKPVEYSYAAVLVRAAREQVIEQLTGLRFSGYVGPQERDWVVVVPARFRTVAASDALEAVGAGLAARCDRPCLAVAVHRDRRLRLVLWHGVAELGRYVSAPADDAQGDDAQVEDDLPPQPQGVGYAGVFATAAGVPEHAGDLAELLETVLDEQEQTESERLSAVLRLLGLPKWLVAVDRLPRDVPGGPAAAEVTRLYRGRVGAVGRVLSWLPRIAWHSRRFGGPLH